SRISRISSVMSCNTFDMSVTCSFIGIKVRKISQIHKKNKRFVLAFYKIFEEKVLNGHYR
ncbi:MAG: hypothetical protein KAZ98_02725, partial [Prevotella sp.]|nr:hypothetical protein [Prevotella sp.]